MKIKNQIYLYRESIIFKIIQIFENLDLINKDFNKIINITIDKRNLKNVKIKFIGKNGLITIQTKKILYVPKSIKRYFGEKVNVLKKRICKKIQNIEKNFESNNLGQKFKKELIDVTLPGRSFKRGRIHPISQVINQIKDIFYSMTFKYVEGPDIEDEWNNFSALNIIKNHPARQMHDTFYLKKLSSKYNKFSDKEYKKVLRTHTSSIQARYMLNNQPPFKIFSIGKVYRSDFDITHTPMFHQLECLVVNKKSNILDMQMCLKNFFKLFFNIDSVVMRFRSSYFPFTEPSFEVDVKCDRTNKREIKIGVGDNWLEILGCGMVNFKVLENVKIKSDSYQGFAFGVGIERLAMLKYNISDLRDFFEGDLRWLDYYGF